MNINIYKVTVAIYDFQERLDEIRTLTIWATEGKWLEGTEHYMSGWYPNQRYEILKHKIGEEY